MSVDGDRVQARLVAMQEMLGHLSSLGEVTLERLESDFALRLQVERVLSQVVTLATEVNAHVVARVLRRAPADARESFTDMAKAGWLPDELARRLRDSPGMRNVLIHGYVQIDLAVVAASVPMALEGYGSYVRELASRL